MILKIASRTVSSSSVKPVVSIKCCRGRVDVAENARAAHLGLTCIWEHESNAGRDLDMEGTDSRESPRKDDETMCFAIGIKKYMCVHVAVKIENQMN